jgi:hypothetical protein
VTSEEIEPLNAVGVSQEDSAEASVAAMEEGDCQDGKKRKEHPPPPQNRFKVLGQMIMAMKRFQGEARQQALYSNMPQVLDRATTFLVLVQLPPRLSGCRRMFFFRFLKPRQLQWKFRHVGGTLQRGCPHPHHSLSTLGR